MPTLMTAAPVIEKPPDWIPTGNLYVALPQISRQDGGIYTVNVTSLKDNGLLELCGCQEAHQPFLRPFVARDGARLELNGLEWERLGDWLPRFRCQMNGLEINGTIFAPTDEKGFVYLLEVVSPEVCRLNLGFEGWWKSLDLLVFSARSLAVERKIWQDGWTGSLVGEASCGLPLLAWGIQTELAGEWSFDGEHFESDCMLELQAGEAVQLACYVALNLERDGARTGALHLRRLGWRRLLDKTRDWLTAHSRKFSDPVVSRFFHENLYFNYFFAQSLCLDQAELALMTSRSRSYYVSAAYWARDACLWSFPGLVLADPQQARRALQAIWRRYLPEAAQHALYLNGQTLYPGFELDQACAPLVALDRYLEFTGDGSFSQLSWLPDALDQVYRSLTEYYDPQIGLYRTFLTPHDDPTDFPYLTYNNVLVWRALTILSQIATARLDAASLLCQAHALKQAIQQYCVHRGPFGAQYVAAIDATGHCDWQDLPGGSWSLFPFYGFCAKDDPIYLNSLQWIDSEHNSYFFPGLFSGAGAAHFPFPSCFDLANRLLRQEPDAMTLLHHAKLDHGLACESFDPHNGVVRTGAAFATLAGFLAFSLYRFDL